MYRFLFFYANMIVNKNEVLNKVKVKVESKFNWVGADRVAKGETKTPKPKSQTRVRKEVAVAEEGERE